MRRAAAAALVLAALAAGCSRPSGAVEVPPDRLPFSLERTAPPSPPAPAERLVAVYLVRDGRLAPVTRLVSGELPRAEAAMRVLLLGPTEEERAAGTVTAVPSATQLVGLTVTERVAEVDLSAEFQSPAEPQVVLLRVAQVVWTLVEDPEVAAVRFLIDGEPIEVPVADGTTPDRPVTAADFASVGPIVTEP